MRIRPLFPVAIVLLAACQTAPVPQARPEPVSFAAFAPIVLDVASVGVTDGRRPPAPGTVPADGRVPTPAAEAVRRWAAERLRAGGAAGRAQVTIRDASVAEVALPRTGGVRGYFTNDQAQRYDGRIEVEVTAERPGATTVRGTTRAVAAASATVAENASLAERERAIQEVVRRMAEDLNARLDAGIRRDLAAVVLR